MKSEELKQQLEQHYFTEIVEAISSELEELQPLFDERESIRGKISNLQEQAAGLDNDILKHKNEISRHEQKCAAALEAGQKPSTSKKVHEKQASLEDLNKWRKQADEQLQALYDSLNQVEKKISAEWHMALNRAKPAFDREMAKTMLAAEAIIESWSRILRDFENQCSISRRSRPPKISVPHNKLLREEMRPPGPINAMRALGSE